MIAVGDSHLKRALVPEVFENAVNLCQDSEPLYLSYWKIKHLLKFYHPKYIVLGFGPHNLSTTNDYRLSDTKWCDEFLYRSYPIAEYNNLPEGIEVSKRRLGLILLKNMCFLPKSVHTSYVGSYSSDTSFPHIPVETAIKRHYPEGQSIASASSYLDSLVHLCQEENVELICINTPVTPAYYQQIPASYLAEYNRIKAELSEKGVWFLDYGSVALPASAYFDSHHIRPETSHSFSSVIQKKIDEFSD